MASISEAIKAAYAHVYTDEASFTRAIAAEFTIANMGQPLDYLGDPKAKPEKFFIWAYDQFASDCGCEDISLDEEHSFWVKEARKLIAQLKTAGWPFTLTDARIMFETMSRAKKASSKRRK